jgi:hypothetical protein
MNTQTQLNAAESIPLPNSEWKPYPPSYVDSIMDTVKRLPIPYGITYLIVFIALVGVNHIVSWADGWLPPYTFNTLILLYPLWFCLPLAIMTYLNSVSLKALSDFGALLDVPNETMQRLECEFTKIPQRGAILSGVFWAIWFAGLSYLALGGFFVRFGVGTPALLFFTLEGLITFLTGSAIYYHSMRQLRLVHKTVNMVKQFDLFRLEPVYAFSAVTSRTAIAWVLLLTLTLLVFPIEIAPAPTLVLLVAMILLAISAFVLPLRIVNQRLVAEKRKLLTEHNARVQSTLTRLHRCLDENALGEMVELNDAIIALNSERGILDKIPTWPWRTGLLTGFLSIVVLPIILFLIQLALSRLLGN